MSTHPYLQHKYSTLFLYHQQIFERQGAELPSKRAAQPVAKQGATHPGRRPLALGEQQRVEAALGGPAVQHGAPISGASRTGRAQRVAEHAGQVRDAAAQGPPRKGHDPARRQWTQVYTQHAQHQQGAQSQPGRQPSAPEDHGQYHRVGNFLKIK